MKIYQFNPSALSGQTGAADKKKPGGGGDFASILQEASAPSSGPNGAGNIISMENIRALNLPPPTDLGTAGRLLSKLETAIKAASLETLEKVHNLEGLLYIHNKNNPA